MKNIILILLPFMLLSCGNAEQDLKNDFLENETAVQADPYTITDIEEYVYSEFEQQLLDSGLVDVGFLDSNIIVDVRYASENNFTGQKIYENLNKAFLQADVAEKLKKSAMYLQQIRLGYILIVYDAARPFSAQQFMWDVTEMPLQEKTKYLSNPKAGSVHNYGAAVDLSIVNENGEVLDMGTEYDFFGELAQPAKEAEMLALGKLTQEQVNNRKLLREVMKYGGFYNLPTEWWHFNSCSREAAKARYGLIR
jgi:zinc D-Ala-D-Ala dipeptidase